MNVTRTRYEPPPSRKSTVNRPSAWVSVFFVACVATDAMSTRAPAIGALSGPTTRPMMISVELPTCAAARDACASSTAASVATNHKRRGIATTYANRPHFDSIRPDCLQGIDASCPARGNDACGDRDQCDDTGDSTVGHWIGGGHAI